MKILKTLLFIALVSVASIAMAQKPTPCCIDFDKSSTFPPGNKYTNPNDSVTYWCWYELRTDKLVVNGNSYYSFGRLDQAPATFGAGQVFNTNNIVLKFIAVGNAKPVVITFDYLDMGGTENLSINGRLYSGELNKAPASFGNVTVVVTTAAIPPAAKGKTGTVTITGVVKQFKIGGQEFFLDNICFISKSKEKTSVEE